MGTPWPAYGATARSKSSHQAFLMKEMGSSPEIDLIARAIDDEVRLGAIEIKGAWSKGEASTGHRLIETISRSVTHAMNWLGSEYAIAGVSDTLLPFGIGNGARQVGTVSVPFPDERYRTIVVEWRRSRTQELFSPDQMVALRQEAEQLARGPEHAPRRPGGARGHPDQGVAPVGARCAEPGTSARCSGSCGRTLRSR